MFACLLLGDSLALGVAATVNARIAHRCEVRALKGASSATMARWPRLSGQFDTSVLSIGSNDDIGLPARATAPPRTDTDELRRQRKVRETIVRIRASLSSRRVIWLLPYERARAGIIVSIATRFGDEVLDLRGFESLDGVHPRSFASVTRALLK